MVYLLGSNLSEVVDSGRFMESHAINTGYLFTFKRDPYLECFCQDLAV
jgi:hypothetical protein